MHTTSFAVPASDFCPQSPQNPILMIKAPVVGPFRGYLGFTVFMVDQAIRGFGVVDALQIRLYCWGL